MCCGWGLVLAGLYGLHRLALWAESRNWIYYKRKPGGSGSMSSALLQVQALFEPSKQYVLEERARDGFEEEESGDPPDWSRKGRRDPK